MSEYQRFISYMYEYRGNNRHANCGYARIDNRNQILKLEIHMKISAQAAEAPIHIYGCFQRDGQLYGIELGQHTPSLGMLNWRIQCSSRNLSDSDISFTDLEGLILNGQDTLSYCSIWNDQSIRPMDMIPYPVTEPETSGSGQEMSTESQASPSEAMPEQSEPNDSAEKTVSEMILDSPDAAGKDASDTSETDADSPAAVSANDPQDIIANGIPSRTAPAPSVVSTPRTEPTLIERVLAEEYAAGPDTSPENNSAPEGMESMAVSAASAPPSRWDRLTKQYPRADVFTDGELKNCVRVEPRDFPKLRREGWNIAGNRFILHCFQRNAHCLIGRIGDSQQYVFAVPGIYDSQERFMANMFGFPCFKSITPDAPLGDGQKGYWYRSLH